MIYESIILITAWLAYGIVCLTGLWSLITLTYLRIDWTAFGKVKILFMTLEHNCMEPEVDPRYVLSNVIE